MAENIYKDFFSELKYFLTELGIDQQKIAGCSDTEILSIEDRLGTQLPEAYKEYLKSIGKKFLFEFFDAEQMSFEDYEDINEYVTETLMETGFSFEKEAFPISHRRYDYFRFFYLNESENPDIWFFDEYPQNGEHTEKSGQTFVQMILIFFSQALTNQTAGFHWVSEEETERNENVVRDRYLKWFEANVKLKDRTRTANTDNPFVIELYERFSTYFSPENEKAATEELKKYKHKSTKRSQQRVVPEPVKITDKQSFWTALKRWFS
ncbi:SMI1/KNR4 family protein [Chryseobacterium pennipullorum]|uniref:Knr4/Smi1-like domain-containing protein n=1 Tax=Chryseobacterium pennipullorum TaxID=2258963 RepID=A0A3D9AUK4_9FLAO|nr:SMI1/KNR4 family protein [Chryseobacterium pennipullorum]REC44637.1 hypothetical protein DRF67_17445 [Chryseobacterium pennipullorum]